MTPYDWGSHGQTISFNAELTVDDIEVEMNCKKILHRVLNFSNVQRKVIEEPRKVDRLFRIIWIKTFIPRSLFEVWYGSLVN